MFLKMINLNGVLIITPNGKVDSNTCVEFGDRIFEQLGDNANKVLLNLQKLEYISSAGLRVLLKTYKTVESSGGKVVIVNVSDIIMKVFEVSGFDTVLRIFNKYEDALKYLTDN